MSATIMGPQKNVGGSTWVACSCYNGVNYLMSNACFHLRHLQCVVEYVLRPSSVSDFGGCSEVTTSS